MTIIGTKRVAIIDFFRDTIIELKEGGRHTPFEVLVNSLNFLWQKTKETANSSFRFLAKSLYFGHDEIIRKFIDAVEKNTEPPVPAKDGKLSLKNK